MQQSTRSMLDLFCIAREIVMTGRDFLSLPGEVRNQIYHELFQSEQRTSVENNAYRCRRLHLGWDLSILRVNKSIHAEAAETFLRLWPLAQFITNDRILLFLLGYHEVPLLRCETVAQHELEEASNRYCNVVISTSLMFKRNPKAKRPNVCQIIQCRLSDHTTVGGLLAEIHAGLTGRRQPRHWAWKVPSTPTIKCKSYVNGNPVMLCGPHGLSAVPYKRLLEPIRLLFPERFLNPTHIFGLPDTQEARNIMCLVLSRVVSDPSPGYRAIMRLREQFTRALRSHKRYYAFKLSMVCYRFPEYCDMRCSWHPHMAFTPDDRRDYLPEIADLAIQCLARRATATASSFERSPGGTAVGRGPLTPRRMQVHAAVYRQTVDTLLDILGDMRDISHRLLAQRVPPDCQLPESTVHAIAGADWHADQDQLLTPVKGIARVLGYWVDLITGECEGGEADPRVLGEEEFVSTCEKSILEVKPVLDDLGCDKCGTRSEVLYFERAVRRLAYQVEEQRLSEHYEQVEA